VLDGTKCDPTGTCGEKTGSTTACTGELTGDGDVTGESVFTCTGCEPCTEITKVIGGESDPTGICGVATIITSAHAGSGAIATERLDGTNTASVSTKGSMGHTGAMSVRTGICIAATTTITTCMGNTVGHGAGTGALVCISIVCAHCIATTRVIGVVFAHTGICIVATTITSVLAGSGATTTGRLAVTSTGCGFTDDGMVRAGTMSGVTGIFGGVINTITTCMVAPSGSGVECGA